MLPSKCYTYVLCIVWFFFKTNTIYFLISRAARSSSCDISQLLQLKYVIVLVAVGVTIQREESHRNILPKRYQISYSQILCDVLDLLMCLWYVIFFYQEGSSPAVEVYLSIDVIAQYCTNVQLTSRYIDRVCRFTYDFTSRCIRDGKHLSLVLRRRYLSVQKDACSFTIICVPIINVSQQVSFNTSRPSQDATSFISCASCGPTL